MNRHLSSAKRALICGIACMSLVIPLGSSQTARPAAKTKSTLPGPGHRRIEKKPVPPAASQADLDNLRQLLLDQHRQEQKQLDELQQQNDRLVQQLKSAQEKFTRADQQLVQLQGEQTPELTQLQSEVLALKSAEMGMGTQIEHEQKIEQAQENPLAIRYRGITIVPGGFFAAEALYRSHAENADINTSWASIPYDAQSMSHVTEFRASARGTRLSLRADGAIGRSTLTGYFETDFLGSGFGASEVQTNGYSNRVRQMWGRAQLPNGWTFTAGQMWSLLTTNRAGIENLAEMTPALIDATVLPGFDYARQTSFRVTKRFDGNKATAAFSAENAATVGVTPGNVPSSISSNLSGLSTTGTGVMSNTTYSTNVAPDLIAKVAFDPGFGHFEIRGIGRTFRDRLNATTTTPGRNNTVLGGAIGGAAYFPVFTQRVNYLVQGMWGAVGRYGSTSTDVVVKPNGALSPEKSIHAISGFETHPTARLDWYAYAGDEYLPRNYGYGLKTINNTNCFIETGFSCSASVRNLQVAATGFWYRFYKGPAGTLQSGADYVYVVKSTWVGVGGAPRGIENIVETSFRYYLP